jgi:SHS2 domain-containing protein
MVGGYRFIDYMADAYIEAWGDSLEEAFAYAAIAFYDTMIYYDRIDELLSIEVYVKGYDLYELLYNWIEELIYLFETKRLVFKKFDIRIDRKQNGWELSAHLKGEEYLKEKHGSKTHIKAITYHEMKIEKNDKVMLRYILDL